MRLSIYLTSLTLAAALTVTLLAQPRAAAPAPVPNATDQILAKMPLFTKDDPWNQDVSKDPVDPSSDAYIQLIGAAKPLHPDFGTKYGIPFQIVDKTTPRQNPKFEYADETDKPAGGYPIPNKPLIEGTTEDPNAEGDRHILCIDKDTWKLYELYHCFLKGATWDCGSGAVFDLTKKSLGQRPQGWTSADAAGLPIFPGLVRYDEVAIKKEIPHAIRFTIDSTMRGYVSPATHFAPHHAKKGSPPLGIRVRLKADFDIKSFPPDDQVILTCLKKYGMILADNGSDWYISGAPDPRWNDDDLNALKKVKGKDFEVVKIGEIVTR